MVSGWYILIESCGDAELQAVRIETVAANRLTNEAIGKTRACGAGHSIKIVCDKNPNLPRLKKLIAVRPVFANDGNK